MNSDGRFNYALPLVCVGLIVYSIRLTLTSGDIGFEGDDWWVLSTAYWNAFPQSIIVYAKSFLRPVEGAYYMTLFELFGFNRIPFHLISLLLLAGSAILMGLSLITAFPERRNFVFIAVGFAFFIPTVSCLTYVLCTDNSRLSMTLFWGAVLSFQKWRGARKGIPYLLLGSLLYISAFLTYEASSFLIFAIPLLVWPIHKSAPDGVSDRSFFMRMISAILICFGAAVAVRLLFLSGGAVGQRHLIPPLGLLFGYLALIPIYLIEPFKWLNYDFRDLSVALFVFVVFIFGILYLIRFRPKTGSLTISLEDTNYYILFLGFIILILGMAPYQLAGYGGQEPKISETAMTKLGLIDHGGMAWFNFNWSSRIYSSASYGIAILLALTATGWKSKRMQLIGGIAAAMILAVYANFHSGLSSDWRVAADQRNKIVKSLLSVVPEVKSNSNFVFLNLESFYGRAPVFRGWAGLRELVRMLYHDPSIGAWYLYSHHWKQPNTRFNQAIVLEKGFISRGMDLNKPAPHNSLILMERIGDQLALMNGIRKYDGTTPSGIEWRGASNIKTSYDRISAWTNMAEALPMAERNLWSTGLISSLKLSRMSLDLDYLKRRAQAAGSYHITKNIFTRIRPSDRRITHLNVFTNEFNNRLFNRIWK